MPALQALPAAWRLDLADPRDLESVWETLRDIVNAVEGRLDLTDDPAGRLLMLFLTTSLDWRPRLRRCAFPACDTPCAGWSRRPVPAIREDSAPKSADGLPTGAGS